MEDLQNDCNLEQAMRKSCPPTGFEPAALGFLSSCRSGGSSWLIVFRPDCS